MMQSVYRMKIKLAVIVVSIGLLLSISPLSQAREQGERHVHKPANKPPHHNNHHSNHHSNRHRHHHDRWSWGLGFGVGFPYWNSYRPYWGTSVYVPYRYTAPTSIIRQPKVVSTTIQAPQQVTTHVEVNHAINSLPANARVKQKNGRTVYEWQGTEYIYDWQTQSYKAISPPIE